MTRVTTTFLTVLACLSTLGCSTSARLTAADVDALTGLPWIGTLTYLDYTSGTHTTIDSTLVVQRTSKTAAAWEFATGYSKEPRADSTEIVALSDDGRMLGDARVIQRDALADGGIFFVTESTGDDDHRASDFRLEHSITAHEYSRRKLVRFEGEPEFFERHIYRWKR